MQSLSIKAKTISLIISIVVVMSIIISMISIYEMKVLSEKEIENFERNSYAQKEAELKNYIDIAKNIIISNHAQYGDAGKEKALKEIEKIRFGGSGYYWIHDTDVKMVMHPIKPSLNGKDLSNVKDKAGKYLFVEMVKVAKASGEGKVSYMWPKPNEPKPIEKFSHVSLFKPWGWIIGTGAYVDDVEKSVVVMKDEADMYISDTILYIAGLTLLIIILAYALVTYAFNFVVKAPIEEFKEYFERFLEFISLKSNRFEFKEIEKSDELSDLQVMINNTAKEFDMKLKNDIYV